MIQRENSLSVLGWREWVALPELSVKAIKAKIDTGAKTSSLHAYEPEKFRRHGGDYVRFQIHPLQRSAKRAVTVEARLIDVRSVRSSSGHESLRYVISTYLEIFAERWSIELTLADRDTMGFRMLLGREALRGRFLVDSGRSYCDSSHKPQRKKA